MNIAKCIGIILGVAAIGGVAAEASATIRVVVPALTAGGGTLSSTLVQAFNSIGAVTDQATFSVTSGSPRQLHVTYSTGPGGIFSATLSGLDLFGNPIAACALSNNVPGTTQNGNCLGGVTTSFAMTLD